MECTQKMPENAHPMTMFNTGILSMQSESVFYKRNTQKACQKQNFGKQC